MNEQPEDALDSSTWAQQRSMGTTRLKYFQKTADGKQPENKYREIGPRQCHYGTSTTSDSLVQAAISLSGSTSVVVGIGGIGEQNSRKGSSCMLK